MAGDKERFVGEGSPFSEVDDQLIKALWRLTFDVGGEHYSRQIRDEGTIDWVADGIRRAGIEGRSVADVAALGLYRIVREHPFVDCNHRTGWLLCRTLMLSVGFETAVPRTDVIEFVRSIDAKELSLDAVEEWVRRSFYRLS